jgi:hypothetical protein
MRSPMRPLSEQERQALIKLPHSLLKKSDRLWRVKFRVNQRADPIMMPVIASFSKRLLRGRKVHSALPL